MRKLLSVAAVVLLLGGAAFAQASRPRKAPAGGGAPASGGDKAVYAEKGWRLVVYYLHGTYRCPTCLSIERQSKETVETVFADDIKAGRVVFRSLNYEGGDDAHFATDYSLMTRSLVLSLHRDGKEVKWKNLPEIWTHVHTPEKFREYVRGEVAAMLKEMR